MSDGIKGFFVPGSMSGSYVASKRNEEGSYQYDAQAIGVGMQKQAALQDLEKSYETTISKAYNSYLANQQGIRSSQMGQGYKKLYEQAEEENLIAKHAEATMNVSQVKSQLLSQEQEAQANIQQQYQTEVANLDRVARSMQNYLSYVKSLEGGLDYLSKLSGITVTDETLAEDLYETLYSAQPQSLVSAEDSETKGLPFSQWLHTQLKETDEDIAFEQWLYSGGWQDFQKSTGLYNEETEAGKKYTEIENKRKEQYNKELTEYEHKKLIKYYDKLGANIGLSGEVLYKEAKSLNITGEEYIDLSTTSLASGVKINNSGGKNGGRFSMPGDTTKDKYGNTWEYDAQTGMPYSTNQQYDCTGIDRYAEAIGISAERIKNMKHGDIFKVGDTYYLFTKNDNVDTFAIKKITKK